MVSYVSQKPCILQVFMKEVIFGSFCPPVKKCQKSITSPSLKQLPTTAEERTEKQMNMFPPLPWGGRWLRPQSFLFRPDACLDGLGGRRTERAGGLAGGWELELTGCCKGVGWSLLPGKPQTAWGAGAQNGLGGWGLQDAAGVPPRVSQSQTA